MLNPDYKWRRLPFLPILFDENRAKEDAKQLNKALISFNGNCKWVLHRKWYSFRKNNLFILTIRERHYPKIYKRLHKTEAWEAAVEDIMPLAKHLKKTLAESNEKTVG